MAKAPDTPFTNTMPDLGNRRGNFHTLLDNVATPYLWFTPALNLLLLVYTGEGIEATLEWLGSSISQPGLENYFWTASEVSDLSFLTGITPDWMQEWIGTEGLEQVAGHALYLLGATTLLAYPAFLLEKAAEKEALEFTQVIRDNSTSFVIARADGQFDFASAEAEWRRHPLHNRHPNLIRETAEMWRRAHAYTDKDVGELTLYIVPKGVMGPNAFIIEPADKGTLVVSEELLESLDDREVRGVIAHEIAHLENDHYHINVKSAITWNTPIVVAGMLRQIILRLPGAARVLAIPLMVLTAVQQFAHIGFVRHAEIIADKDAAAYSDDPLALGSGLRRISREAGRNPDSDYGIGEWFTTHPSAKRRMDTMLRYARSHVHFKPAAKADLPAAAADLPKNKQYHTNGKPVVQPG